MLTPFGKTLRKLRIDRGLRLLDLASGLKKSTAYLSAVETGRRSASDALILDIAEFMELSDEETFSLTCAAAQTRKLIKLNLSKMKVADREVFAALARRINNDGLDDHELEKLRKIVFGRRHLSHSEHNAPFSSRRRGLLVPPLRTTSIRSFAEQIRAVFVGREVDEFPIMDVLEFRLHRVLPEFVFAVGSRRELGEDEGRTIPGTRTILLRCDVYERAWNGAGRDRFTAAHELGHLLMHDEVALARIERSNTHPIYRDSEWQADTFSAGLLVPPRIARKFAHANDMAAACGITHAAANVVMNKYESDGLL